MADQGLRVSGVSLKYHTKSKDFFALKDITFSLSPGSFVAVLGPSGCGKSTLIKMISGLMAPTEGEILLNGSPITGPSRHIGVVFQKPNLLPWKNVLENVLLSVKTRRLSSKDYVRKADDLLELVGLSAFRNNYPFELSGGMAQRVGIARMLLSDPDLLLMDEPFAALDALSREQLGWELLRVWSTQRKSVLFITHSIPEAVLLADRILVLSRNPGTVIEDFKSPLPRPRVQETINSVEFANICQHLRDLLIHA